ncbi:MAG: sugar transferase [Acidobacteriia bacterium]|nr:sugar transferase [Terriglobia bacterium]
MNPSIGLTSLPKAQSSPASDLALVTPIARRTSAARFRSYLTKLEVVADFVTVIGAVMSGYFMYYFFGLGKQLFYPRSVALGISATFAAIIVLMLDRVGAYSSGTSLLRVRETEHVLRVSMQALGFAFAVSFFTSFLFSRWLLIMALGLVPLFLFVQKHLVYLLVQSLHSMGYGMERVLIYGSGSTGRRVYSVLRRSPKLGLEPVAFVDDNAAKVGCAIFELGYENRRSASVMRGPISRHLVTQCAADLVVIAIPSLQREKFQQAIEEALAANARVSFVPSHFLHSDPWVGFQDIDGVLLASFSPHPRRFTYEWAKRICDFGGAAILLTLGSPLFLLLAILIKLDSKGPALFRQERVGLNGRRFRMFKFRTMYTDTPSYAFSPKKSDDIRITRVGRFLRRTSLDELPQLLNVLVGDMSLVGPRPEMPFIVETYAERHFQRLQVEPGITGLWQLSGDRSYLIHENIEYDLYYIQHRNFFMDLAILLHTTIFAMRGV